MYGVPTKAVEPLESKAQKVRIRKEGIGREKEASGIRHSF